MLSYYMDLAFRSLKRNKALTVLMVIALGLGIGASMTMLTVLHVMTANPIPGKSARLFTPQLDPQPMDGYHKGVAPPINLTRADAMNLLRAGKGVHQAALVSGRLTVVPPQGVQHAFRVPAHFATADFFRMFDVPFIAGGGWTREEGEKQAHIAVISDQLAEKVYGTSRVVGRRLRIGRYDFRVVGVTGDWNPSPHFYDLSGGMYAKPDQVFVPLQTALQSDPMLPVTTSMECFGPMSPQGPLKSDSCAWMHFWVQLDTPAQVAAYRQFLVDYSMQQKKLGRFHRPPNVRLHDVMQWLDVNHVVPGSVQLQSLLALGFMLVCLVNTVALLLVKFLRRGSELSVRRAMGASRRDIFAQLLVEAVALGLAGGLAGLGLSWFGLWVVREQPVKYASLAHLDASMLAATFVLAVCAMLMAALFPAWRACRLVPARLLKTQ